jgi:hypothetical protein
MEKVKEKKFIIALGTLIVFAIIVLAVLLTRIQSGTVVGAYDALAKCLSEKGVKMYGAWWCPHCQNQKKTFGSSWKYINDIECAIGQSGQTRECKDAGIESYPTWVFPDGTRVLGEQSPESLADKVGCKV